jgi:mgtE-like transporter
MALGYVRSFKEEVKEGLIRIFQVEPVAAFMHIILGVIAYTIVAPTSSGANLLFLAGFALVSNLNTFLVISLFALVVAFLSYRRGLNPDNVVIPAITSISDTVATMSMLPSIYILKMILTV